MTNPTVTYLRKVYDLIRKGWARKTWARNKGGHEVGVCDKQACHFCLSGALLRVYRKNPSLTSYLNDAGAAIRSALPPVYNSLVSFNDNCNNKRSVLKVIKEAISRVKTKTA